MAVVDTRAALSLFAENPGRTPDCLLALREGDIVTPQWLDPFLPGLTSALWRFCALGNRTEYLLTAITDDVVIELSLAQAVEQSSFLAEGCLRGIAARFVVSVRMGPGSATGEES